MELVEIRSGDSAEQSRWRTNEIDRMLRGLCRLPGIRDGQIGRQYRAIVCGHHLPGRSGTARGLGGGRGQVDSVLMQEGMVDRHRLKASRDHEAEKIRDHQRYKDLVVLG